MIRFASVACAVGSVMAHAACTNVAVAGTLTSFDLPGQTAICGTGIADDGTVVGNNVTTIAPAVNFLYRDGSFTLLSPLFDSGLTGVAGINRAHAVVGTHAVFGRNFSFKATAFVLRNGVTRAVRIDGAADVFARAISNNDVIVGSYDTGVGAPTLGYVKHGDTVTTLNDGSGQVQPTGIEPGGTRIVGYSGSVASSPMTGWQYAEGKFTPVNVPKATATLPTGINHAGTISGSYIDGNGIHGFLYAAGSFSTFDVPGASMTELTGINVHGAVTGCYTNASGTHGLIYQP